MDDNREKIVEYLNKELVGPAEGEREEILDKPHKRYLMGVLFPKAAIEDEHDSNTPEEIDNSVSLASEFKPSSMALSFAVTAASVVKISIRCGIYEGKSGKPEDDSSKTHWRRTPLEKILTFNCSLQDDFSERIFEGRGKFTVIKRNWKDGFILTVSFSNEASSAQVLKTEQCLYQSSIYCETESGRFAEYPSTDRFRFDQEQQELDLLYRKRINWSVGHGCSSVWDRDGDVPVWIKSISIPTSEVYGFTTNIDFEKYPEVPSHVLSLQWLANENTKLYDLTYALRKLLGAYSSWIENIEGEGVLDRHRDSKTRVLKRLHETESRIRRGIDSLEKYPNAMNSFRLANRVMLMQMAHSGEDFSGSVHARNTHTIHTPDYFSDKYEEYRWRPFQLAFILLVIESLVFTDAGDYVDSRDIVDLLWFPTGGGKTEAYLAVAAWEMIFRRLEDGPKGAGTAVIKRYTLRLLTSQQFQRAGTMICALEMVRRNNESLLGKIPYSLGLWVGQDSAPNRFTSGNTDKPAALELYNFMREEDKPENPFQLQHCPWCGTKLVPDEKSLDDSDYGIRCSEASFEFYCPTDSCSYNEHLPIQVVDEALYRNPPSMLIGTVDKFARLAWMSETRAFFGLGVQYNPPSLIIQDELHLISGPLGSIAGLYEAGIDALIRQLGGHAKVIAATATIRAADQQNRRLFGRKVQIFPPPGIDESDSFFSSEDKTKPGRLYLGVMPSGHTGQTALVQTAAAMLQAPIESSMSGNELDTWWTLPIYHNSRRELGKTMTLARDDIPARIEVISSNKTTKRGCEVVEELSANVRGARIPEVLEKLKLSVKDRGVIDILPCTNMISVGVDISRLGIMLINGQPKTTAEYIQASSRVGRDKKRPPAIIVTLFSPSKPRDRSHYETFSTYHQALYRHVEPTSITPWAKPARERALHAALIILVRLSGYLLDNDMAGHFDKSNTDFQSILENLKSRIMSASIDMSQQERDDIIEHIDVLVDDWHSAALDGSVNRFESEKSGRQFYPLMKVFGKASSSGKWGTLNSMRNVDTETALKVKGE
ncbi:helicase-related protein [Marinobacterium rhizophilum]|uniref:helicase-related protein n=1 Tax=Marinobacterium rhizophilum TaxID=420402 RepID=UPI0003A02067|nr:helicase-related protein [Marinobacterium rhizophilum]